VMGQLSCHRIRRWDTYRIICRGTARHGLDGYTLMRWPCRIQGSQSLYGFAP
jgi:hypothetical protein